MTIITFIVLLLALLVLFFLLLKADKILFVLWRFINQSRWYNRQLTHHWARQYRRKSF